MLDPSQEIKNYLNASDIEFEEVTHEAVMTVEESEELKSHFKSAVSKTLFLTNKKHTKFFIVVLDGTKKLDLKSLAVSLGESKLTFASGDELKLHLKTYQGAVSPFGAIFVAEPDKVTLVIDEQVCIQQYIGFHPNDNTQTLELTQSNFTKYINSLDIEKIQTLL